MSPEQALARRVLIDHRSDVYSLGVTLYELLTLRPAFDGPDRQEVLRQVAFEEPRPPRQLDRTIPTELQTIVLKAMEKTPTDRYATAQELADDLRRWLLDLPIRARRPTLVQRLNKWGRRHTAAVRAAVAVVVVVVALLGWALWDWTLRRERTELAVLVALEEATHLQEEGKVPEALSAAVRAEAVVRGGSASERLRQRVLARRADLVLLADLEKIGMGSTNLLRGQDLDITAIERGYWSAFQNAGLDVDRLLVEEAGERIGRSTVAVEVAAVLDRWALIRRNIRGADDPSWKALLLVARLADPDAGRTRVREALERRDRQALLALASSGDVSGLSLEMLIPLLGDKLDIGQQEALLREAQRRHPNDYEINRALWLFFLNMQPPQWEEAYHFAAVLVALRPGDPGARNRLSVTLQAKGRLDEAIAECREALRLNKDDATAHNNIGVALAKKGQLDEAIAELKEAIRLKKDFPEAHNSLGKALAKKGRLDEANAEYKEALRIQREVTRLKKYDAEAHITLGNVLGDKGLLDEAIAEYQEALRLNKDDARAQHNLKITLARRDALAKLPAILSGKAKAADTTEQITLAFVCQQPNKCFYAAAARFYGAAFAEEPQLADDLTAQHRYNAACAAALAGCGQGKDVDKIDAKESARLRQQALDWLRADLKAYWQQMDKTPDQAGPEITQRMQHWLQDTDFAGVRGSEALAKLPEVERKDWHKLWQEVEALRKLAAQQPKTASPTRP
jgi:serine/threonine-protein kinase